MIEPKSVPGTYRYGDLIWTNPKTRKITKAIVYRHPELNEGRWLFSIRDRKISLSPTTWEFVIKKFKVIIRYELMDPLYHFDEKRDWAWDYDPNGSRWSTYEDKLRFHTIPDDPNRIGIEISGGYSRKHDWSICHRYDGGVEVQMLVFPDRRSNPFDVGPLRFEHGQLVGTDADWIIAFTDYRIDPILRGLNIHSLMNEVKRVNTMQIDLDWHEIDPKYMLRSLPL